MNSLKILLSKYKNKLIAFDNIYIYFQSYVNKLSYNYKISLYSNDIFLHLFRISNEVDLKRFKDDIQLEKYIKCALKRYAITLYHKQVKDNLIIYNSTATNIEIDKSLIENYSETLQIKFNNLLFGLSEKQKKIIKLRYEYGFSDVEISKMLKISRQAVHKNRTIALKLLRVRFEN